MKKIITLICLFIAVTAFSQTNQLHLVKGKITANVHVPGVDSLSYAIYLPSSFEPSHKYALIFSFDPDGKGEAAVKPFISAAEKYKYLVIGLDGFHKKSDSINVENADLLFRHVLSSYPIDEQSIYTAGLSEGAELASAIAVMSKKVSGIINCGGSIPAFTRWDVDEEPIFVAVIGDEDCNYSYVYPFMKSLDELGYANLQINYHGSRKSPIEILQKKLFGF